jgi:hypothetical protein
VHGSGGGGGLQGECALCKIHMFEPMAFQLLPSRHSSEGGSQIDVVYLG